MPTLPGATSAREHGPGPGFVPEDVLRRTRKQPSSRRASSSRADVRSSLQRALYESQELINPRTYRYVEFQYLTLCDYQLRAKPQSRIIPRRFIAEKARNPARFRIVLLSIPHLRAV